MAVYDCRQAKGEGTARTAKATGETAGLDDGGRNDEERMPCIRRLTGRRQAYDRRGDRCQGQVRIGARAGSSEAPVMRSRLASRQGIRRKISTLILSHAAT